MDDDNNIENNNKEIETINSNFGEKLINSDMERLNKENEISTKEKIEQEIKEEIIIENKKSEEKEEEEEEEEDDNIELNDDGIEFEQKSINIIKVKAGEILKEPNLEPKENLDLLKIELFFSAKKGYKWEWEVYRTPKETKEFIKKLYKSLHNDKTSINLGIIEDLNKLKEIKSNQILDSIPLIKEEFVKILANESFNNNAIINEFLNIGGSSFSIYNNGNKPYEGWGGKKADPHCLRKVFAIACKCLECCIFKQFNDRWIILQDDMIMYSNFSQSKGGKHAYLFDEKIKAVRNGKYNITVTNLSRILELKFKSYFERELWIHEIEKRIKIFKQLIKNNIYKSFTNEKKNNYAHWFVDGKDYYEDLYEKLMDAEKTIFITDWWMSPEVWLKRPILESDYNKSSKHDKENLSRLMDILEYKAKQGVKIFILLYYECSLALTLNSKYTQDTLEKLHKNIRVTRHPKDKLDLLWSHHEKLVVIDQQIGYVGGLDLCWGRYDFSEHPIYEYPNSEKKYYFPFIDYSNARICDFSNVENYLKESVARENNLRMPWHDVHTRIIGPVVGDIARHFVERWNHDNYDNRSESTLNVVRGRINSFEGNKLKGSSIKRDGFLGKILESVREQMEKDNNDNNNKNKNKMGNTISGSSSIISEENNSNTFELEENYNIKDKIKIAPVFNCQNNAINEVGKISINKDVIKEESNIENKDEEIKITNKVKRIMSTNPEDNSENNKRLNSIRKSFIGNEPKDSFWEKIIKKEENNNIKYSRTISIKNKNSKFEIKKKEWMENLKEIDEDHFLVPRKLESMIISTEVKEGENENGDAKGYYERFVENIKLKTNDIFKDIYKANNEIDSILFEKYIKKDSPPCSVQVLRSAGYWSLGLSTTECSILEAYYQLIEDSKHYIYIENQFFISKSFEEKNYLIENKIALYIRNRILRAAKNKEKFKVWIFIPLLPGFAGEPEDSGTLQIILKYTYNGICKNDGLSIIEKLQEKLEKIGENWEDYIGFYSLRNHGLFNGIPRTEIIYIHSKLMIVDDLYVICGSANINDRSMKGSRDSEFAVLIKERKSEISIMNGKRFKVAKFAKSLRRALMAEHLGIKPNDEILVDPLSDNLFNLIRKTAKDNTFFYRQIFACYPDDCYTKFNLIKNNNDIKNKAQEENLKQNYEVNKNKIIGHIVEFPLHFLEEEDLGISFFSKENLVPERNFT